MMSSSYNVSPAEKRFSPRAALDTLKTRLHLGRRTEKDSEPVQEVSLSSMQNTPSRFGGYLPPPSPSTQSLRSLTSSSSRNAGFSSQKRCAAPPPPSHVEYVDDVVIRTFNYSAERSVREYSSSVTSPMETPRRDVRAIRRTDPKFSYDQSRQFEPIRLLHAEDSKTTVQRYNEKVRHKMSPIPTKESERSNESLPTVPLGDYSPNGGSVREFERNRGRESPLRFFDESDNVPKSFEFSPSKSDLKNTTLHNNNAVDPAFVELNNEYAKLGILFDQWNLEKSAKGRKVELIQAKVYEQLDVVKNLFNNQKVPDASSRSETPTLTAAEKQNKKPFSQAPQKPSSSPVSKPLNLPQSTSFTQQKTAEQHFEPVHTLRNLFEPPTVDKLNKAEDIPSSPLTNKPSVTKPKTVVAKTSAPQPIGEIETPLAQKQLKSVESAKSASPFIESSKPKPVLATPASPVNLKPSVHTWVVHAKKPEPEKEPLPTGSPFFKRSQTAVGPLKCTHNTPELPPAPMPVSVKDLLNDVDGPFGQGALDSGDGNGLDPNNSLTSDEVEYSAPQLHTIFEEQSGSEDVLLSVSMESEVLVKSVGSEVIRPISSAPPPPPPPPPVDILKPKPVCLILTAYRAPQVVKIQKQKSTTSRAAKPSNDGDNLRNSWDQIMSDIRARGKRLESQEHAD